jgi:hypothetical protein
MATGENSSARDSTPAAHRCHPLAADHEDAEGHTVTSEDATGFHGQDPRLATQPWWPRTPEPPSVPPACAPVRWNRARQAAAAALAAAFAVLLPAAITSAWIRGTILSTSGYVAAVTPAAASPAARAAVQDAVTSQVDAALSHARTSLPPSARVLAGPLGAGLAGLARNGVSQLMASQAFQRLWAHANRLAHSQLISVLNGDSALVTATGGEVALNLLPLVNDVLHTGSGQLSAMTGGAVSLPPVTTISSAACHATIETASSACTQIPLFPAAALAEPRHVYRILVAITSLVLMLTPLVLAGALAASPHRRRTLLQITIGGTLTLLAVMTAVSWGQSSLINRAAPRYQAVTSVIVHALTTGFFTMTTWCVAGGFAITAIALLSGPYRWTTAIRAAIRIGGLRARAMLGFRFLAKPGSRTWPHGRPTVGFRPGNPGRGRHRQGRDQAAGPSGTVQATRPS